MCNVFLLKILPVTDTNVHVIKKPNDQNIYLFMTYAVKNIGFYLSMWFIISSPNFYDLYCKI